MTYGKVKTGATTRWPWTLSEEDGRPYTFKSALAHGINFFDTANVYSDGESEAVLGRAIRDFATRDEAVIANKVWGQGPTATASPAKPSSELDKAPSV